MKKKNHFINRSSEEIYFYKLYANMLTKIKNLAKKLYFYYKFEESKNNLKKTWKLLRILLPFNKSSSTSYLEVINETFTNSTNIANQPNYYYFVNIDKSFVTNLSGSNDNDYLTYLKSPCPSSIYIYPTTHSKLWTGLVNIIYIKLMDTMISCLSP